MFYSVLMIIGGLAAATFLSAYASRAFAYELSRALEATFDYFEYRSALRRERKRRRSALLSRRAESVAGVALVRARAS